MIREFEETDLEDILEIWYQSTTLAHPFMGDAFLEKEAKNIRDIYIPNTKTWVYTNAERH